MASILSRNTGGGGDDVVIIHDALGYSHCRLSVAVPEAWTDINSIDDLSVLAKSRNGDLSCHQLQWQSLMP